MRILWLKTELLHPVDRGGRIRTYQMLRQLRREHEVTYVALDDGAAGPAEVASAEEYCHRLIRIPSPALRRGTWRFNAAVGASLFSDLPFVLWRARSAAMRTTVVREATPAHADVLVCDFLLPAVNLPPRMGVANVLFQHNVEAVIWQRHAEHARGPVAQWFLRRQWRRMVQAEAELSRQFDRVIAVSEADRRTFEREYSLKNVASVPTGVDTEYFRPDGRVQRKPRSLVFTGAMDWLPNEDGMRYFVEEVLPLVRQAVPDVTLTIVGRSPTAQVRDLAARAAGIVVTGSVPDVRPHLEEASVFVVPLRIGGGTRLKIFEAMAMELPVVSTRVGAEGLSLRDGRDIVLADEPEAMAAALARLLEEPEEASRLGRKGAELVRAQFSWEVVSRDFARLCEESVAGREAGAAREVSERSTA